MESDGEMDRLPSVRGAEAGQTTFAKRSVRGIGQTQTSAAATGLEAAALEALDKFSRGVFLLDRDGKVLFFNRAAEAMLERKDGLLMFRQQLQFQCTNAQTTFQRFLAESAGIHRESLVFRTDDPGCGSPYRVLVSPLTAGSGYSVFIYEPNGGQKPLPVKILGQLYRLTEAEVHLANELFSGKTLAQAARARTISINTAKYTLKSIFTKCNVSTRVELMLLLSLGPRTL